MYVQVRLLNGWQKKLTYSADQFPTIKPGMLVRVPLQKRMEYALVEEATTHSITSGVRPVEAIIDLPIEHTNFISRVARYYGLESLTLYRRLFQFLAAHEKKESTSPASSISEAHENVCAIALTAEQQHIVDTISHDIGGKKFAPSLIHGVTGSGKTEIYKALLEKALDHGSAFFLAPEVAVAGEMLIRLRNHFGSRVYGLHAGTPRSERIAVLNAVARGERAIIVGVHMPIMLPVHHLALIIIDEEHADGFVEKQHPKISSRDCALMRAFDAQIPIVLGSATPSAHALLSTREHNWKLFTLAQRFAGEFPTIRHVLLQKDPRRRASFWISKELEAAIKERLVRGEQAILFINRRGYSFFVQCGDCSAVSRCVQCSVSLTLHAHHTLECHYCGYTVPEPATCTSCNSSELIKKGIGTEKIVEIVSQLFPTARIARGDLDTVSQKKRWQETVEGFKNHTIDILVGTQTITKGFDFPRVTLVGVIWADSSLSFPDYRSLERTVQQLIQVSGRAGRAMHQSEVIIQSIADHEIFNDLREGAYLSFMEQELSHRKLLSYPPFTKMAEFEIRADAEHTAEDHAQRIATLLRSFLNQKPRTRVLGPTKPPVDKIKNIFLRTIIVKSSSAQELVRAYSMCKKEFPQIAVSFSPSPL